MVSCLMRFFFCLFFFKENVQLHIIAYHFILYLWQSVAVLVLFFETVK